MIPTSVTKSNYASAISWVRFVSTTISFPILVDGCGTISNPQDLDKFLNSITSDMRSSANELSRATPGSQPHAALGRLQSLVHEIGKPKP